MRLHKIGVVKKKIFDSNFDKLYDFYKEKAELSGYWGDIKFIKEKGKILIYVVIELPPINPTCVDDIISPNY